MEWLDELFEVFCCSFSCFIIIRCQNDSIDILIQDRAGKIIYTEGFIHNVTAITCEHIEVYLLTGLSLSRDIRQSIDIGFCQDKFRSLWIHFDEESSTDISTEV